MKDVTRIAAPFGGLYVLTATVAGCGQDQRQAEMQQRMRDDSIRFEAYSRGFRDGVVATVKHEVPDKRRLKVAPILAEM
ncbi:MAG: hypothetical protein E6R14_06475, partial [Thermomicrobiales bacterium]